MTLGVFYTELRPCDKDMAYYASIKMIEAVSYKEAMVKMVENANRIHFCIISEQDLILRKMLSSEEKEDEPKTKIYRINGKFTSPSGIIDTSFVAKIVEVNEKYLGKIQIPITERKR